MAKMVDVAKHAGVSVKTVSRVLNNEPHVQEKLRERVMESVKLLGYVPSASARNLRSNRTYTIHVIAHTLNSNFVTAVQSGALLASQQLGYTPIFNYLDPELAKDKGFLKTWCKTLINDKRPDGIILVPPYTDDIAINEIINSQNVPIVRIGPNDIKDNNITVMINDVLAARTATQHLISLGHKCIAFIRGLEDQGATHKRFKGYSDALKEAGIALDPELVFPGLFNFESGMIAGEKIFKLAHRPTAIFAANDDMAAGIVVAAHKNNVAIPQDVSIIGFDNSELSEKIWPPLTTINQPRVRFGERAAEILIQNTGRKTKQKESFTTDVLDYELIVRKSTGQLQTP